MTPAFEELFDSVEEHTLSILLEPWTLLVNRDKETLQKVTGVHPQFNHTHTHKAIEYGIFTKCVHRTE